MMKKVVLFMFAIGTLTACIEDVYQEADKLNGVVPGTNPKATGSSGNIKPYTSSPNGYESPWDINSLNYVQYYFNCYLSWDNIYVRVTPYIGLAYYDGADDGIYNPVPGVTYNLAAGYPNLHTPDNIEYGNYIAANPIVLEVNNDSAHELAIFSDWVTQGLNDHCPVMPSVYQYPFNWQPVYFDLVNNEKVQPVSVGDPDITPAPPQATAQEVQLLKDYGKVMYYKVEFGWGKNNYTDTVYVLALEDKSGDALSDPLSITDTFDNDLYFHNGAGSMEIVVDPLLLGATGTFNFVRSEAPISVSFFDEPLKIVTSYSGFVTLFVGYHP